jgi:hypothetical protein
MFEFARPVMAVLAAIATAAAVVLVDLMTRV